MLNIKSKIKTIVRSNKYLELFIYILQNIFKINTSGDGSFSKDVDEMYIYCRKIAKRYISNYDKSLENKILLEIGTDYSKSTMLFLIKNNNLQKVYAYDRFHCLHKNDDNIIRTYGLEKYLDRLEYTTRDNEMLKKIDKCSIDLIISNAVLEHVDNVEKLFNIITPLLKSDGIMYHKVDLKCHNRFKKYGELYFHSFNDFLWNLMGNNISQPNRMLKADYMSVFQKIRVTEKNLMTQNY